MTYIFDYGDEDTEEVTGKQLSELYVDMTMYGNGRHVYTEGMSRNFFIITKTRLYKFDPLKPHFYIEKLGFTRVYIIFSSPEPKAQGEVLWSLTVRRHRRPSVCPSVRPSVRSQSLNNISS